MQKIGALGTGPKSTDFCDGRLGVWQCDGGDVDIVESLNFRKISISFARVPGRGRSDF